MLITDGIRKVRCEFDSLHELLDYGLEPTGANCRDRRNVDMTAGRLRMLSMSVADMKHAFGRSTVDFYDGRNLAMVMDEYARPPREYLDGVERIRRRIEAELDRLGMTGVQRRRRLVRNLDDGEELDPQAWAERRSDGWSEVRRESRPHRVMSIGCCVATNAHETPDQLFFRGAAAAALADAALARGFSVSIDAVEHCSNPGREIDDLVIVVPLKRSRETMDVAQITYAMASVAFFRMAVLECIPRLVTGPCHRHLGHARSMAGTDLQFDASIDRGVTCEAEAVACVAGQIKAMEKRAVELSV